VVDLIVSRCNEVASGGRMIDAILTNTMLPELSIALLERQMAGQTIGRIEVGVADSSFTYEFTEEVPYGGIQAVATADEAHGDIQQEQFLVQAE
jgi:hypothetical protein